MIFKVIIAGPRNFTDYELAERKIDNILSSVEGEIEIVSGSCDDAKNGKLTFTREDGTKVYGADGLGERYAKERGYKVRPFYAEWDLYGKSAGPLRNEQMAEFVAPDGAAIVFYHDWSKGSKNMIAMAKKYKLKLRDIKYEPNQKVKA